MSISSQIQTTRKSLPMARTILVLLETFLARALTNLLTLGQLATVWRQLTTALTLVRRGRRTVATSGMRHRTTRIPPSIRLYPLTTAIGRMRATFHLIVPAGHLQGNCL